jgi:hypothetical protein
MNKCALVHNYSKYTKLVKLTTRVDTAGGTLFFTVKTITLR